MSIPGLDYTVAQPRLAAVGDVAPPFWGLPMQAQCRSQRQAPAAV